MTDAGIEAVAAQTTLTMLALQNCRGVSSQVMVAVLKNNRRLKHLNIKNCRQVTDSVLQAIGKHCPKLLTLNLMGCRNLTDAGLRELSTLDKITDLNLWGGGTNALRYVASGGSLLFFPFSFLKIDRQLTPPQPPSLSLSLCLLLRFKLSFSDMLLANSPRVQCAVRVRAPLHECYLFFILENSVVFIHSREVYIYTFIFIIFIYNLYSTLTSIRFH